MPLKKLLLLFAIFITIGCNTSTEVAYTPKYAGDWDAVKNTIIETWVHSKTDSSTWQMPGSLNIPHEYFSIYEGRNVLYYWDTYFTNAGLLLTNEYAIYAKNAVDNLFAEIEQIGYVPNASEPWALNRSQIPCLSMMVRKVYEIQGLADKQWLAYAYTMLKKEYRFWTNNSADAVEYHSSSIPGLQRFGHHATNEELLTFFSQIRSRFNFSDDISDNEKISLASHMLAEAESGMDFTPRFDGRCRDFIPVDLNSNLYLYERNFNWMVKELGLTGEPDWNALAKQRKELLNQYCWNEERGVYLDYDYVNEQPSKVASVVTFYPMWAGLASTEQAERIVDYLSLLEFEYGVAVCEKTEQPVRYQWDYPVGWPPMYYLVTFGLDKYGYTTSAQRIAGKYLDVVTRNYLDPSPISDSVIVRGEKTIREFVPGHVYEKYNVVDGSLTTAEYANRSFHGWSYGVYLWCLDYYREN